MLREISLTLAIMSATARLASAEADPDLARWEQPDGMVVQENDPAAPFICFFTPIYRDEDAVATWSMMATKWRSSGQVDLSVGIRLVHTGTTPWRMVGARLEDGAVLSLDTLEPVRTCGQDGICVQRETGTISLSGSALRRGAINGMRINLVTADGTDHLIAFPQDILDQLSRRTGAERLP